jgi:hypothetical protein
MIIRGKVSRTEDGIDILPARVFAQRLWKGALIAG